MSSFSLNAFGASSTVMTEEKPKNKALRYRSYNIESLEISRCAFTVDIIPYIKALLTACCSIQTLTLQQIDNS